MFYDLHVHSAYSIGENSIEEMAEMAKRLGLSGIAIAQYYPTVAEIPKIDGIDIVSAVMIKASSPKEMGDIAEKMRKRCELLLVHGGDYDVNRAACENPLIDILCHPELGRKDNGIDHICVKAANENNVAIEINFREILESYKRHRVYVLGAIKKNIKLCEKYDTEMVTTSAAVSKWGLRSGRELAAIAHLLGLELGHSILSVSDIPKEIIESNRKKLSGRAWEGIEIIGDEKNG